MDKLKTKRVVMGAGIAAPEYAVLCGPADLPRALRRCGSADDGQARLAGLERRHHQGQDGRRSQRGIAEAASAVDPIVFAEQFIAGGEYTVGVLRRRGAALDSDQPATEFYDYEAKYFRNDTSITAPADSTSAAEASACRSALEPPSR